MYTYQRINEQQAMNKWSKRLSEATGVKDPARLRTMCLLAETKVAIDGPTNTSEKKLMES